MVFSVPKILRTENDSFSIASSLKPKSNTQWLACFMIIAIGLTIWIKADEIIPRFFLKPPRDWLTRYKMNLEKIMGEDYTVDDAEGREKLFKRSVRINFGWKNGCIRRWLLLNSVDTFATTNYSNYKNVAQNTKHDYQQLSLSDRLNFNQLCDNVSKQNTGNKFIIGIFHPFCNSGGGGERVLWELCYAILQKYTSPEIKIAIYTGDVDMSPAQIIEKVDDKFGIKLDIKRICFIYLKGRDRVEGKNWTRFTLLMQAISSILLFKDAISKLPPDCFIDTMGYPFVYPFMKYLYDIPVLSYTHYPIIQKDMLNMNKLSTFKKIYWSSLYYWYKFCGNSVDYSVVNSTWTKNHMDLMWKMIPNTIIYPPCLSSEETNNKGQIFLKKENKKWQCVLVAQFRPEKRHSLAIKEFSKYLKSESTINLGKKPLKLIFIGSTRSHEDDKYLKSLEKLAYEDLKISKNILEFKTNLSYAALLEEIQESKFGLNTMWNEHFGISVVEYFANGTIPLAHASAGPLFDIVGPVLDNFEELKDKLFFADESDPDYNVERGKKYKNLSDVFKYVDTLYENSILEQLSGKGFEYVLNKFSNEKFDKEFTDIVLIKLYEHILRCKAKRGEIDSECA
ncbi:hypothetical protein QEN19_000733 [Hanseniaspora menglaensis]